MTKGLVKLLVILLSSQLLPPWLGQAHAGQKSLVRIWARTAEELSRLPRGLDVAGGSVEGWIDAVATPQHLADITATGLTTEIIHLDVEAYSASVKDYYHSFEQLISDMEIYTAVFPQISSMDTLGFTYEGRPLVVVKISDNVAIDEPGEPELLFMGLHHAREWPSLEIAYFIFNSLLISYYSDPHIKELVDSREIWVMPCVNPDGYAYCHDQGNDWRRNRRFFPQYGSYGVDLNRNYDGACNGDPQGAWGTTTTYGTSHYPWDGVYCGPFPFSEIEIQAVRDLFLAHNFIFSVSYHTYYEAVIWPWAYSAEQTVPDDDLISDVGAQMASRITRQSGSGTYLGGQSTLIGYTTTGDTDDWAYGYSHYALGSNCLPFTVEACSEFHPPDVYLDQIVRENFDGAIYLCEIADSVAALMTPRAIPPIIVPLGTVPGGDFTIHWSAANPEAGVDSYQLDELAGLSVITDQVEQSPSRWELAGFLPSTNRSHSSSQSYRSSSDQFNAYDAMTTVSPYPVATGDSLTFWCWYDIEEAWDMGYAEVSSDGRCFRLVDTSATFTGSSPGWVRKAYSLKDYAGQSVHFRFRYTTDGQTQREGFYLDDIHPVASFAEAITLSASIADTCYAIAGRMAGDYYYRVRGHNAAWGWGDWSSCRLATVPDGPIPPERVDDVKAHLSEGILLNWSAVTADTAGHPLTVDHYVVYRDSTFDFQPSSANSLATTGQNVYLDEMAGAGDRWVNHCYIVRAVSAAGAKSQDSDRVGEFDRYIQRWK